MTKIEKSYLNYIIHHKTPFSAQISLKRSFVKIFDAPPTVLKDPVPDVKVKDESSVNVSKLIEVTKALEEANCRKYNLEEILEKERLNVSSLESELGKYRKEELKLKREKKDMKLEIDQKKIQLNKMQLENLKICEERMKSDNLLKETTKTLNDKSAELESSLDENLKLDKQFKNSLKEIETLKQESIENFNKVQTLETCNYCDDQCKSKIELSKHIREKHIKDQVSQTKAPKVAFSEFSCFYCEEKISTFKILQEHRDVCREIGVFHEQVDEQDANQPYALEIPWMHPSFPYKALSLPRNEPCYTCGEVLKTKTELRQHYDLKHSEIILHWCDECFTNFGSDQGLKSHLRNAHKIFH